MLQSNLLTLSDLATRLQKLMFCFTS